MRCSSCHQIWKDCDPSRLDGQLCICTPSIPIWWAFYKESGLFAHFISRLDFMKLIKTNYWEVSLINPFKICPFIKSIREIQSNNYSRIIWLLWSIMKFGLVQMSASIRRRMEKKCLKTSIWINHELETAMLHD